MTWYRWDDDDLVLRARIQPGARDIAIVGLHGDRLKVRVTAPPQGGRANNQLIALLSKSLRVPRARVVLEHGSGGRRKRLRIVAATGNDALQDWIRRIEASKT